MDDEYAPEQVGARHATLSWTAMGLFVLGLLIILMAVAAITVNLGA